MGRIARRHPNGIEAVTILKKASVQIACPATRKPDEMTGIRTVWEASTCWLARVILTIRRMTLSAQPNGAFRNACLAPSSSRA